MDELMERLDRIKADRAAAREAAPDCPKHPGEKTGYCQPCDDAQIADRAAAAKAYAVATASRACDSAFPARYRDAVADHPDVLAWVAAFRRNPTTAPGLLLMGPTGTGKTYQAYGALRAAVAEPVYDTTRDRWTHHQFLTYTMADLNAAMRPSSGNDPEATLKANRHTALLLLDDLGAARGSEWVEDHLYRLVNARYETMRPSIFTTNLEPAALREAIGERITSRLVETCTRVILNGTDRRRARNPQEALV